VDAKGFCHRQYRLIPNGLVHNYTCDTRNRLPGVAVSHRPLPLYYNAAMRLLLAIWRAIQTFLETLWRVTRQLFHEVAGAAFLLLSISGGFSTWRYWKSRPTDAHGAAGLWSIGLAAAFTLMMAAFSVASFRSARRVR